MVPSSNGDLVLLLINKGMLGFFSEKSLAGHHGFHRLRAMTWCNQWNKY